jgi:hypothetical protein
MTKAEMRKEWDELMAAYDRLWVGKERYKRLWKDSNERMVALHDDLKQILEGIK